MNTEQKRTPAIAAEIVDGSLQLVFANGQRLEINPQEQLTDELYQYAAMHGLKQKLVDAAAISRNPETGRAASIEDKYNAVKAVFDRLLAGQWNAPREGAGAGGGLLFKALCRMYAGKKTDEAIREFLEAKTDAEKTALRKNPKVAAIIEEIRAESGKAANIDTDELLGELED
jgi:hypothetical protein